MGARGKWARNSRLNVADDLPMIFCIGERVRYEAKLELAMPVYKRGRGFHDGTFYEGGSVWQTERDARAFIIANKIEDSRAVYGVLADWEADTVQVGRESYRRLTKTSEVVRLSAGQARS
jgi:hypothetical protein